MWLWIHPAAFNELLEDLNYVAESYNGKFNYFFFLFLLECYNVLCYPTVTVKSLAEELLRFELTGPRAHDVVRSVLQASKLTKAEGNANLSSEEVPLYLFSLFCLVC